MAGALLLHDFLCFGNPLTTNPSIQSAMFRDDTLLFGVLGWPTLQRFLWLTVHPFRGIFYQCPVLLIALLSFRVPRHLRAIAPETVVRLLVAVYFLLFNMSFNGWTGGWGVGSRYLIPGLPFLFSFSLAGFRRFRGLSAVLIGVSAAFMLSVTAVGAMMPAPNEGPPPRSNPVLYGVRQLMAGRVSISVQSMLEATTTRSGNDDWDSYNLGEVAGLRGATSLIPAGVLIFAATGLLLLGKDARVDVPHSLRPGLAERRNSR